MAFNRPRRKLPDNKALSGIRSRDLTGAQENRRSRRRYAGQASGAGGERSCAVTAGGWVQHAHRWQCGAWAGARNRVGTGDRLMGVLRANRGMLVTTETRTGAAAAAKDMGEAGAATGTGTGPASTRWRTRRCKPRRRTVGTSQRSPAHSRKQNGEIHGQGGGNFPRAVESRTWSSPLPPASRRQRRAAPTWPAGSTWP